MTCPLIRIDTNQGIYGLGEVRDGASKTYALMLKSRVLGENPCNVDKIFRKIKQFGFHARQAGGVCGIEMALWDLAGKAYNVPIYQMLGGKFRDKIRCYADTTESEDPQEYGKRLKLRKEQGFTWLKMDLGIDLLRDNRECFRTPPARSACAKPSTRQHMSTGIEMLRIRVLRRWRIMSPRYAKLSEWMCRYRRRPLRSPSPTTLASSFGPRFLKTVQYRPAARGHDPVAVYRSVEEDHRRD